LRMIFSENQYPPPIKSEDTLFGIMRQGALECRRPQAGASPCRPRQFGL
jgi:hypothetical protein